MPRRIDNLLSIVVVKCREGYEATARFVNPHQDFIVTHVDKEFVHLLVERKIIGGWK